MTASQRSATAVFSPESIVRLHHILLNEIIAVHLLYVGYGSINGKRATPSFDSRVYKKYIRSFSVIVQQRNFFIFARSIYNPRQDTD